MSDRPDVCFLVLDSMRRDRVSTYGHERETTPTLTDFAGEATTFENAYTPAPWTLPSHCSMFTGAFPSEHGVTNGFADGSVRIPEDVEPLGERLADAGYRTAGFSNNPWVGQLTGLDRGFEEFVEWDLEISRSNGGGIHTGTDRATSELHTLLGNAARQPVFLLKRRFFTERLVDRAIRWIESTSDDDAPTFTFLNLMEAHSPYFPPDEAFEALGLADPSVVEPRLLNTKLLGYVMGSVDLDPADRRRIMEYYDASLRYQDGQVARLFDALRERGAWDDTLVVVCSDHGKTLGDFDRDETPPHYTRSINVNVPLFVKRPGQRSGLRESAPVELTGLHDLILSGGETHLAEATGDEGVALVEDYVPHTGSESPEEITRWRVVADEDHRLVRSDEGEVYLFSTAEDAAGATGPEATDERVEPPSAERLRRLRTKLTDRANALGSIADLEVEEGPSAEIDGTVQRQLEDLGYM